ncbi:MAG: regulatory protein UhpC [Methanosaeta sp. PtaU1.Bin112]|nr:MAG: regulatory protein UhpC [Methanosaeta sp. PtaU1.Bin112]
MMNRTMKLLLLSDIFVLTGFGLIQPILAIYINDGSVTGGTMLTAGMASALFMLTKSLVQLPFGHYVDRQDSKERWLVLGTLLMAAVPLIYLSASSIYQVYLAEVIYGLGSGLAYPTWLGLWSVNLDRGRESFQWSVYHTSTGVGAAATGAAGAAVASHMGFSATFLLAGLLCILGCLVLLVLERRSSRSADGFGGEARFRRNGMGTILSRFWKPGPNDPCVS